MNNLFRPRINSIQFKILATVVRFRHKKSGQKKSPCTGKSDPLIDFHCKLAVITGGADGIGLTIAHELLSERVQNVALLGNNLCRGREAVQALNCAYGKNRALFINCDVQNKTQVAECYEKLMKEFKKLDIVVNAAGIFDGCNWEKEMLTNFNGTLYNMLEAYKVLGKGSVILNISGLYGIKPLYPAPTYAATQHALIGLSRSFGDPTYAKKTGVRVITLCPGFTNTNLLKNAPKRALNKDFERALQLFLSKVKRQNADVCGKSAIHVMKYGVTGSVWVVTASKLYSLNIPSWKTYRILESQLI